MNKKISRRQLIVRSWQDAWAFSALGMLPALNFWSPEQAMAQTAANGIKRLVIIHMPNGFSNNFWPSSSSGTPISLSPVLAPFTGLEQQISLVKGIIGTANSHTGIQGTFTGANHSTDKESISVREASLDRIIADNMSPSEKAQVINLGAIKQLKAPAECYAFFDVGGAPINPKLTPKQAIDTYFPNIFGPSLTASAFLQDPAAGTIDRSLNLNFLLAEVQRLQQHPRLNAIEKAKMNLHANAVSDMLKSAIPVSNAPMTSSKLQCQPANAQLNRDYSPNNDNDYEPMIDAYLSLIAASITCQNNRIFTLQLGKSSDGWKYPNIGQDIPEVNGFDSHGLTHRDSYYDNGEITNQRLYDLSRQRAQAVCTWYASKVANFARKLSTIPENTGSVLDNTLVVWSSEFGPNEGKHHGAGDLAYVLVGGKNLGFASGKFYDLGDQKKANSVLLSTIAQGFGVNKTVGREGGTIAELRGSST